jgi:hypothetical protein
MLSAVGRSNCLDGIDQCRILNNGIGDRSLARSRAESLNQTPALPKLDSTVTTGHVFRFLDSVLFVGTLEYFYCNNLAVSAN